MSGEPITRVVATLRDRLAVADDGRPDGDLLGRYLAGRDEAAFAALVRRHGPLVLGVCRRVLGNRADAEDAFQAAFLVLARHAGRIRSRGSVASWLHGVALRVAQKALVRAARQRKRDRGAAPMSNSDPLAAVEWADVRPVIDEELDRLGEKYRGPVALCLIEGKSHEEAARVLGWPAGSVSGRLARAKELLRHRLARRGVTCPAAAIAAVLASQAEAVPARLVAAAVGAAAAPTAAAADLARGVTGVRVVRWKVLTVLATAVGVGALLVMMPGQSPGEPRAQLTPRAEAATVRLDHGSAVLAVGVSARGLVATAGPTGEVRLWNPDGSAARRCEGHVGGVVALQFAPDGQGLATAGYDGDVRLWDVPTGKFRHALPGHGEAASGVAFAPDGRRVATAGWDGQVRLWDADTGRPLWAADAHVGRAWGVAFAPDGQTIASAGGDQKVRLWDAVTGDAKATFGGLSGGAYAVAYSADGQTLAVAAGNTVRLLDAATGRDRGRVAGPSTAVAAFTFSAAGYNLAWADDTRTVRLYELASGAERFAVEAPGEVAGLAFTPDGRGLVAAGAAGAVVVWDLPALARDRKATWEDLVGADPAEAFRAVHTLAADPKKAVPLLAERLRADADLERRIAKLVGDLDHARYAVREQATRELRALGPEAAPNLRAALARGPSAEV
ncbi:MAG TPA: sigma-70 family RNA polymerase sigma factor, partial [Gemmataceae bacterium]|nr:sigma-70 family RNA polymerase sigma factor [Gemmataceae bacterium]